MSAPELTATIQNTVQRAELVSMAVAVHDLHTGFSFRHEAERWFHAASTYKAALLVALLKAEAEGKLRLNYQLHVRNRFLSVVRDTPPFRIQSSRDGDSMVHAHVGHSLSLGTLAEAMITRSSNLATNLLLDYLTTPYVREVMKGIGALGMNILRGVEDLAAHELGMDNECTADGLLQVFRVFTEESDFLPAAQKEEGLRILRAQEFNRMIPARLPNSATVAHKTGEISTHSHDAGLVFPKNRKPYLIAILTESDSDAQDRSSAVAQVSAAIYEAVLAAQPEEALA